MLTGDNIEVMKRYSQDKSSTMQEIKKFVLNKVDCWCKNRSNEWFAARDLVGRKSVNWNDTPLKGLYNSNNDKSDNYKQAGIKFGHILKCVLKEDGRTFETRKGFTREYRWLGN